WRSRRNRRPRRRTPRGLARSGSVRRRRPATRRAGPRNDPVMSSWSVGCRSPARRYPFAACRFRGWRDPRGIGIIGLRSAAVLHARARFAVSGQRTATRTGSVGGREMKYHEYSPHSILQDTVKCFWIHEATYASETNQDIAPDGCVELIFNFGSP